MSWKTVELGTLVELITKGTTPTSIGHQFSESGINFIKIESIDLKGKFIPEKFAKINDNCNEALKRSQLKEGDILFSIAGALGRTAIVTKDILPANTNQALGIIRLKNSELIFKEYLVRVLNSESILNQIGKMKGGVAQQNLSLTQLKEFQIPLPPLATQQKIVAKLDAIFTEIDKAIAATEANAKNAEALFQSYMSQTFAECESLHSRSQLISICDLQNGYAFKSADYVEYSETLNIRMSSIRPGGFFDAEHNKRYLPDSYAEKYKEFLLKEGDLVIAMTDMAGDPKILGVPTIVKNLNGRRFVMNQRVGKLHKFSDSIHIPYLRYFLTSPKIKEFYKNKGDGGLQINISKKDILSAEIPLPPLSIQEKIGKEMSYVQTHSEISKNRYYKKINEYIALKQSILKQAFAGELVKE